jgi:hypothetical protein
LFRPDFDAKPHGTANQLLAKTKLFLLAHRQPTSSARQPRDAAVLALKALSGPISAGICHLIILVRTGETDHFGSFRFADQ